VATGAPLDRRARAAISTARRRQRLDGDRALYSSSMRRTPFLPVSIGLLGVALLAGLVTAAPRARRFFSARHGVGIETPVGWSLSKHTGFPDVLAVLLHPSGGRLSLSAAPTIAPTAQALADQSRRGLEAQKLAIARVGAGARGGVELQARNAARRETLRQLYLVRPVNGGARQAVVLTLVAPDDAFVSLSPTFEWAAAHLALEAPLGAPDSADAGSSAPQRAGDERDR
jgi:hypothetical protein